MLSLGAQATISCLPLEAVFVGVVSMYIEAHPTIQARVWQKSMQLLPAKRHFSTQWSSAAHIILLLALSAIDYW